MTKRDDLSGRRFGRLSVIQFSHRCSGGRLYWSCKCDCGNASTVRAENLRRGKTSSCGCLNLEQRRERASKHGLSRHPLYDTWKGIVARCDDHRSISYRRYGGRGIENRFQSLAHFVAWAEALPSDLGFSPEKQIDRIDNNGHYSPDNCRFVMPVDNARNRSGVTKITIDGHEICLAAAFQAAKEAGEVADGLSYDAAAQRIRRGADFRKAIGG